MTFSISELRENSPGTVRKNQFFEVFLTPQNLPIDDTVLGMSGSDLSNSLRYLVNGYSINTRMSTVEFTVLQEQDRVVDLAFIKAREEAYERAFGVQAQILHSTDHKAPHVG